MTEPISLTSTLADRRFGLLILGLFSTFGLYGLIWIQASIRLQAQYDQVVAAARQTGIEIAASTRGVEGFPFRLELHAQAVKVTAPWGRVETDLIVLRGLPFQADHWVIDGGVGTPTRFITTHGDITTDDARASVVGGGASRRISVDIKRLRLASVVSSSDTTAQDMSIARLQYHSRPNRDAGGFDHVLRVDHFGSWQLIEIAGVGDQTGRLTIKTGQIEQGQLRAQMSGDIAAANSKIDGALSIQGDPALMENLAAFVPLKAGSINPADAPLWVQGLVSLGIRP